MKTRRKFMSVLLAICIVLTLVPMTALAKDAGGDEAMWGTSTNYGTSGSLTDAVKAASKSSGEFYIKLLDDVKLDKMMHFSKNVTLDLAGQTITAADGQPLMRINAGTFTLNDSSGSNKGKLTGGTGDPANAGGVTLQGSATFIMNGGSIVKNDGGDRGAGGVDIPRNGRFFMNGGVITDNTANYIQGGVDCSGYIEVSGTATIIGNKGNDFGKIIDSDLWLDALNNSFLTIGSSGLSKSAKIGIYINAAPELYKEFTNPYNAGKASVENFVPNRTKYDVEEIDSDKQKQLVLKLKRAAAPTASVAAGIYEEELTIKLETTTKPEFSKIYYTLDGSDPVTSDTRIKYTQPFKISSTTTVKAYTPASRGDWRDSETAEFQGRRLQQGG